MDKIRVSKVEDVTLWRQGIRVEGTLHLTAHHLIFSYHLPISPDQPNAPPKKLERELWVTFPMINGCTYRPAPLASHQSPAIRIRCRDFTFLAFHFVVESKARDVYDSIRSLSCKVGRIEKLYAFSYKPQAPENKVNGWELYDAEKEYRRLGIGGKNPEYGWRVSYINSNYKYSPTYPAVLVVPSIISDNTLTYAGKYRSRARIPALVYRHPVNNCSITRSSQPLGGFARNRSVQDEKLVAAIFATTADSENNSSQDTTSSGPRSTGTSPDASIQSLDTGEGSNSSINAEKFEDQVLQQIDAPEKRPKVYGAQQRNLIVDARPTVNAIAMQAVGKGSENMDFYKDATKAYLGIDNIHVMRRSLNKVISALKDTDMTPLGPNRETLAKSGWLDHISNLLDGVSLIARQIAIQHSHVLIHCSDGWDRTSQLSALSQLCLDPYYRTLEGFIVLIEKDWLSFGHMFRYRAGLLGSDKWFEVENERLVGNRNGVGNAGGPANAIENALAKAQGFFNKKNDSRELLFADSDGEMQAYDSPEGPLKSRAAATSSTSAEQETATKVDEISPIFHQFLDATYQLIRQHPTRFEFNERFLRRLLYHLYSCQYGSFLYDNERERVESRAKERTRSVWDYFLSRKEQFTNANYASAVDDNQRGQERVLFPIPKDVRWWAEVFGRKDEEMNGSLSTTYSPKSTSGITTGTVLSAVENSSGSAEVTPQRRQVQGHDTAISPACLATGLSTLSVEQRDISPGRSRSPRLSNGGFEVEMQ
ncbi:phosphatase [Pseudovirgaria hyperparasitica]|uniref:Phosphatase n=1 Tax=Pseudovirgaria hyperparasitica TaxID=470096 RepID=A0A6A6W7L7_9PEZI|nr:phosphatase [Pseudovirgaria hyperparasitica]KAF2757950.1 phosphatase [Pseudovirgaria hyperparasitica]